MKKLFLLVLFAFTLFLPAWSQMRGDLNGDNQVDVTDVNIIIDMVLGKQAQNLSTADLDGNNLIDVTDVNIIIDIVLGKEQGGDDEPEFQIFTVNGVSFKMVKVQGGDYYMGFWAHLDPFDEGDPWDIFESAGYVFGMIFDLDYVVCGPYVEVSDFSIGQTEVTQELWQAVMGDNPSYFNGSFYDSVYRNSYVNFGTNFQRPVEYVSWNECQLFIAKLNALTGKHFRLPSEAEWEFVAQGGRKSKGYNSYNNHFDWGLTYEFSGSNNADDVAWYSGNSDPNAPPHDYKNAQTHTVGAKFPNELGIYDMTGNVWEWCQDWHARYTEWSYGESPDKGTERSYRGGSFGDGGTCLYNKFRFYGLDPDGRSASIGLRLAL